MGIFMDMISKSEWLMAGESAKDGFQEVFMLRMSRRAFFISISRRAITMAVFTSLPVLSVSGVRSFGLQVISTAPGAMPIAMLIH